MIVEKKLEGFNNKLKFDKLNYPLNVAVVNAPVFIGI